MNNFDVLHKASVIRNVAGFYLFRRKEAFEGKVQTMLLVVELGSCLDGKQRHRAEGFLYSFLQLRTCGHPEAMPTPSSACQNARVAMLVIGMAVRSSNVFQMKLENAMLLMTVSDSLGFIVT